MAFDIHKKVIVGALVFGVLVIVGMGALVLKARHSAFSAYGEREEFMLAQSTASWDSLSAVSAADLLTFPALPAWSARGRKTGFLFIQESKNGDVFPAFGDTFPEGSTERSNVVLTAQRVAVRESPPVRPANLPYPPPYIVFFRARIFFAAADDWSRHGDRSEALLAMDTAFALARVSLRSAELDRVMAGARIERDGLDLLARDTVLAGGAAPAAGARAAVAPWGRFVKRLETADHWMMAAGASSLYVDSLTAVAFDSMLPLPWRVGAAEAIGMGWAFNSNEEAKGMSTARRGALVSLRASDLSDSVAAVIDRALALSDSGLMSRLREVAAFRIQRQLLFRP